MELTFDPYIWHRPARDSGRSDANGTSRPEWHALAARLAAAHAFQRHGSSRALQAPPLDADRRTVGWGSFHQGTAQVLAGFLLQDGAQPSPSARASGDPPGAGFDNNRGDKMPPAVGEAMELDSVNPKSSADRKDTSGNGSNVAGPFPSGNRGLK